MRIGLIAPPWVPIPPTGYGGTEVVVDNLARGLQELGHDVRLFTVGESTCPVSRDWLYKAAVQPMGTSVEEAAHVLAAYEVLADVDIIHDHTVLGPLLATQIEPRRPPVVTTHHGPFTAENLRIFADTGPAHTSPTTRATTQESAAGQTRPHSSNTISTRRSGCPARGWFARIHPRRPPRTCALPDAMLAAGMGGGESVLLPAEPAALRSRAAGLAGAVRPGSTRSLPAATCQRATDQRSRHRDRRPQAGLAPHRAHRDWCRTGAPDTTPSREIAVTAGQDPKPSRDSLEAYGR